MAYSSTFDERYRGGYLGYIAGWWDAPYSTTTLYTLSPNIPAYGAFVLNYDPGNLDAYSMGYLSPGRYVASTVGYNWDIENFIYGVTPVDISIHDAFGTILVHSYSGRVYFDVAVGGTFLVSVAGLSYQSSEYILSYTPNYIATGSLAVSGTMTAGQLISANYSIYDPNGLTTGYTYFQWANSTDGINWSLIGGATGSSYKLTNSDAGKFIHYGLSFIDDAGFLEGLTSSTSVSKVAADTIFPTVINSDPFDGSKVAIGTDIKITFSESVKAGSGSIFLKTAEGITIATYLSVSSSNLTFNGAVLTINPTANLDYNTGYRVEFSANAVQDLSGNGFVGTNAYDFSTVAAPSVALPSASAQALAGDSVIDAATTGFKWQLSANRTIDWSISSGFSGEYWTNPEGVFTYVGEALDLISYYANVKFNFLGFYDTPTAAAAAGSDINVSVDGANRFFSSNYMWGRGFFPSVSSESEYVGAAGDLYLNINSAANTLTSYEPGSAGWFLLIHELGHSLGLKHPHDDGGTGRPTLSQIGLGGLDIDLFTMMSYNDASDWNLTSWDPATPMLLDVLALQYLYGLNTATGTGDTTYALTDMQFYRTIWDAGGKDSLDMTTSIQGWTVALPSLQISTLVTTPVGYAVPSSELADNFIKTLYWLSGDLENVFGSAFSDALYGNQLDNVLSGMRGNDTLDGGNGSDTAVFSGAWSQHTLTPNATGWTLAGPDGVDTLSNIEFARFSDQTLSLGNFVPTGTVTISGTVRQGQALSAANTLADMDGVGTISYQWKADGAAINSATASSFTLAEAQVGKAITVVASYTDGHGTTESLSSSASAAVVNLNDAPSGTVTLSGTTTQGQTLTAANTLADLDGLGSISYQWKANGSIITGGTAGSFTLSEAQVGKAITVSASYTDGHGTVESISSSASAAVINVNDAPTGGVAYNGLIVLGQTLTAANNLADVDGLGAISYQWKTDGIAINGATASSFTLTEAQVGKTITVSASYTDGHGTLESVTGGFGKSLNLLAYSWKAHTLLDGVSLNASSHSATTANGGSAAFNAVTDTSLSLTASRSIPTAEASATNSAVNLQDAIAILKMIVGLPVNGSNPLSPYQTLAADYDGNGTVGLTDAIGVLKHVVGLTAPAPSWHFVNEIDTTIPGKTSNLNPGIPPATINADLSGTSPVHIGLVGYLRGDVDGSYAGAPGALDLDNTQSGYFTTLVTSHAGLNLSQFGVYA